MDESRFWELIQFAREKSVAHNEDAFHDQLTDCLRNLPVDDIADFQRILEGKLLELYRTDLWAVIYIIQHGCSDDGFGDFRSWVIAQGKDFFDRVVSDPTHVADVAEPGAELSNDSLWHVARDVYKQKTGDELPAFVIYADRQAVGDDWNDADLPRLYPEVWRKFAYRVKGRMLLRSRACRVSEAQVVDRSDVR